MRIVENKLYLDEVLSYENKDELLLNSENVDEIVVQTNDIHPAIMQLLFCISKDKDITIEDEFNKRFFENLKFGEN